MLAKMKQSMILAFRKLIDQTRIPIRQTTSKTCCQKPTTSKKVLLGILQDRSPDHHNTSKINPSAGLVHRLENPIHSNHALVGERVLMYLLA